MFCGKPIIGLAGGIGSGKSYVAKLFAEDIDGRHCVVISSDELVNQAYRDGMVKQQLRKWWGTLVFSPNGEIDRSAVARKIFDRADDRKRLEQFLHPIVNQQRERLMQQAGCNPQVAAFIWDTPLLFETGLNRLCDKVVFIDAPMEMRLERVGTSRGWDQIELSRRENSQMLLDNKREISDYVISNTAGAEVVREQVRNTLSRILADTLQKPVS